MNVQEFLNLNRVDNIFGEVEISPRICDEEGRPFLFKIKALTMEEFQGARTRAMAGGRADMQLFRFGVITRGCVEPCFKDAGSLEKTGARTPDEYIKKVLLAGEIVKLAGEILKLSGFGGSL